MIAKKFASAMTWISKHDAIKFLQVKGKVNAISVDSCQRVGLLFEDIVAACELVNSTRIQAQATGVVPTIAVDKCDGVQVPHFILSCSTSQSALLTSGVLSSLCTVISAALSWADLGCVVQLYLSADSLGVDITTAKSSEVNVIVPGATPEADLVEHAIPEQYLSQYKNGKFVTAPVSHSAG